MIRPCSLAVSLMAVMIGTTIVAQRTAAQEHTARSRTFLLTYSAQVEGLAPGKSVRTWLPVPASNEDQQVRIENKKLPGEAQIGTEQKFGNRILYVEARADDSGQVPLEITYRVTRHEVVGPTRDNASKEILDQFLKPDAKVPITGKPLELIEGKELPNDTVRLARELYDIVNQHMRYEKKGTGWGRGDSVWACEHGYGNCTDFHSLFMSLARSQKIPTKFEIGFALPETHGSGEIAGYHCWAKFHTDRGWIAVDISEANKNPKLRDYYFGNLTEGRVAFSVGRDLELVPRQNGPPLNFFVYPYVEIDGKPYDKITKKFTFKDIDS